jgi:hypothetical protein
VLIDEWVEDAAGSGLGESDPLSHSNAGDSGDLRSTARLAFAARDVREDERPRRCEDTTVAARHTFPHGDAFDQRAFHGVTVNDLAFGEPRVGAATAHSGLWSGKNAEDDLVLAQGQTLAATRGVRSTLVEAKKKRDKNARREQNGFVTTNAEMFGAYEETNTCEPPSPLVVSRSSSVHEGGQPSTVGRKVVGPNVNECDKRNKHWTLRAR